MNKIKTKIAIKDLQAPVLEKLSDSELVKFMGGYVKYYPSTYRGN